MIDVSRWTVCLGVAASLVVATAARDARAEDRLKDPDRRIHVPLTLGLGVAYFLAEAPFKAPLSRDTCRWCGPVGFDDGVRSGLLWDDTARADTLSDATGFVTSPLFAIAGIGLVAHLDGRRANWFDDGLIVAESAAIAGVFNYVIKAAVARERPFVHQLPPDQKANTDHPQDNNQSFYSGHSTLTMSLAVSAGTVASLRGYRHARAIYGGGVALSLTTGYLRIAADKHWSSDVLTGWMVGAAIGYAIPRFVHTRRTEITPLVSPTSVGVAMRW